VRSRGYVDLICKSRAQVGIQRNVLLLLIGKTRLRPVAALRIEHRTRLDRGAPKAVGDNPVAAIHQEIAETLVLAPQIER
jgi:hypothetical protein